MQGKYVICSNQCGAQALLRNHMNGTTFKTRNYKELANQMLYCIDHISDIREQEVFRIKWAKENISGKAIAKYMIDCLCNNSHNEPPSIINVIATNFIFCLLLKIELAFLNVSICTSNAYFIYLNLFVHNNSSHAFIYRFAFVL